MPATEPAPPQRSGRRHRRLIKWTLVAAASVWLLAANAASPIAARDADGEAEIRRALTPNAATSTRETTARDALLRLYAARSFKLLWFVDRRPTEQALALVAQLRGADERGLRPNDYRVELAAPESDAAALARADARLSITASRFAFDLHDGRLDPRDVGYDLDVPHTRLDIAAVLASLMTTTSVAATLEAIEPQFIHYRLLKEALDRYRRLASRPELTTLPDPGRTAKPGDAYVGAPALRQLLQALGDLPSATSGAHDPLIDSETAQGLRNFQARHGLAPDGALGRATYRALTTPFTERIRQIELSLERWRWLPSRLESPAIIVNIPEFRLFALYTAADSEAQMLRMNVIVGKSFPIMQTPVFAADMRYVVLHPYWDVPYSIVKRELLPQIRRDPSYIARNDYEIVRGQTDAAQVQPVTPQTLTALANGTLRLRQRPGAKNPLGSVKFMLPNRHNVYLHGTSAPSLFADTRRAFSHGCVRVAEPAGLLNYVLRNNPASEQSRAQALLLAKEGDPTRIILRNRIRVFIVYATALASEDGRTLFFNDIYGHDVRLQALLDAHSAQIAAQSALRFQGIERNRLAIAHVPVAPANTSPAPTKADKP